MSDFENVLLQHEQIQAEIFKIKVGLNSLETHWSQQISYLQAENSMLRAQNKFLKKQLFKVRLY